jgi:hypothetical protein
LVLRERVIIKMKNSGIKILTILMMGGGRLLIFLKAIDSMKEQKLLLVRTCPDSQN